MGAWGLKTFENDDASDWLYDLEESTDLSVIEEALTIDDEYLEAPDGCNVLAAAEVLLALLGKARTGLPENASEWVERNITLDPSSLKASAVDAVNRVLSEDSELSELWKETDDFEFWKQDVTDIYIVEK